MAGRPCEQIVAAAGVCCVNTGAVLRCAVCCAMLCHTLLSPEVPSHRRPLSVSHLNRDTDTASAVPALCCDAHVHTTARTAAHRWHLKSWWAAAGYPTATPAPGRAVALAPPPGPADGCGWQNGLSSSRGHIASSWRVGVVVWQSGMRRTSSPGAGGRQWGVDSGRCVAGFLGGR